MNSDDKIKLVKKSLYEQIADYLEDMILNDAEFKEGQKLPSEQALAEKFGVSRNVIREALKILKERGLIDPRNGTGSYITKPEANNLSDTLCRMISMSDVDYHDIYEIRIILETASAKRAALRATEDDLERMEQLLEKLKDRSLSVEERREYDFEFHIAIAEAAGNPLLVVLIQTMKNIFLEMIEKGIFISGGIEDAITRHNNILEALKAKDPVMADHMMYDHLHFSEKNADNYFKKQTEETN